MAKRVSLSPKLDTAAGSTLLAELRAAEGEDIVLDASKVELLGARCLEILMGTAAIWTAAGHAVSVENPSPQMIENLGHFGLTPETMMEAHP